jgi:bifunctional UDP-N-acetylglucosamine pyrophosphorylase/glucosamine-1-phosphate N-acetyltransferase
MPRTAELYDGRRLPEPLRTLLAVERPWEVLHALDGFVGALEDHREGTVHPTAVVEGPVVLGPGAVIGPFAWIRGPAWIGAGVEIGHAAIVRGGCVFADGAKVGHASEIKRALLLPGAKAPHFNYVGDSVVGADANLGAGVKIANLKNVGSEVRVAGEGTGLRKFGAAIGDDVHLGCNVVLSPGTVLGARTLVYAGAVVRGVVPADRVVKHRPVLEVVERESRR